jgi:hypothetical protein
MTSPAIQRLLDLADESHQAANRMITLTNSVWVVRWDYLCLCYSYNHLIF